MILRMTPDAPEVSLRARSIQYERVPDWVVERLHGLGSFVPCRECLVTHGLKLTLVNSEQAILRVEPDCPLRAKP